MNTSGAEKTVVRSYKDLIAWQKAMALARTVYRATAMFPKEEIYGLVSQMRRSAVSVASNIAEGQARNTRGELVQFIGHAMGSLAELETQSILSSDFGLLTPELEQQLMSELAEVGRLLHGLRKSLKPRSNTSH